jgi:hypothetical protein
LWIEFKGLRRLNPIEEASLIAPQGVAASRWPIANVRRRIAREIDTWPLQQGLASPQQAVKSCCDEHLVGSIVQKKMAFLREGSGTVTVPGGDQQLVILAHGHAALAGLR